MSPIRPENKARYPADWKQIVSRIAARAGGRCECRGECGRPAAHLADDGRCHNHNGGRAYGTGARVVLTTAHRDHTPENNDPGNLFHACNGCHLHYDRDHHRETAARTRHEAAQTHDLFATNKRMALAVFGDMVEPGAEFTVTDLTLTPLEPNPDGA